MSNTKKKYFITGGGTGGHIYPAIALVRELSKSGADIKKDIFYVGNKHNLEYQIATNEGVKFLHYSVCGMPRKISFKMIIFLFELLTSTIKALFYAKKYKPDVVFATGGYVCAPILFAAKILKIPYVLHDSDAHPGVVTRLFSGGASYVSLSFEDAKKYIKNENVKITGNPIRSDFRTLDKTDARLVLNIKRNARAVLIMGGSLGAKKINDSVVKFIDKLLKKDENLYVIWQTGKKNFEDVRSQIKKMPERLILRPYFENMAVPLVSADIVISRAGSLSLSEILATGTPSILVPYPYAAADHQRANARNMVQLGASVYLDDDDCDENSLYQMLSKLLADEEKLKTMKECAKKNAKYNAAFEIKELLNSAK